MEKGLLEEIGTMLEKKIKGYEVKMKQLQRRLNKYKKRLQRMKGKKEKRIIGKYTTKRYR